MKRTKITILLWSVLSFAVFFCGCGPPGQSAEGALGKAGSRDGSDPAEILTMEKPDHEGTGLIRVGFSQLGSESDWRVANTESMRETFTEENGYELIFEDARQKQEDQISAIRRFILQEVDYIVLAPVVEKGWDEILSEAKEAGIPVIIEDRMVSADEDLYAAWVGTDARQEGEQAIACLEELLKETGREKEDIYICHMQGSAGSSAQLGRSAALRAAYARHPSWKQSGILNGEFVTAKGYETMKGFLATNPRLDVLYCENDDCAFGAMQAMDEAGITYGVGGDVIVIAFDATRAGLTACLDGKINIDVECNPLHGPRVEKIIRQMEAGETPDKQAYVEETYFTSDTITQEIINGRKY